MTFPFPNYQEASLVCRQKFITCGTTALWFVEFLAGRVVLQGITEAQPSIYWLLTKCQLYT